VASDSHAPDSQASDSRVLTSHPCDSLDSQPLDSLNKWTFEIEEVMLNELVHQVVDLGKRADSGFKKEAWAGVLEVIERETGQVLTLERCKNKLDALKTY
jgi:Myb/SANT-like DNA-binding domain